MQNPQNETELEVFELFEICLRMSHISAIQHQWYFFTGQNLGDDLKKFSRQINTKPRCPLPSPLWLFFFPSDPQMKESQRSALLCFPLRNESHIFSRGQTPACWWLGDLHSLTERSRVAVKICRKSEGRLLRGGRGRDGTFTTLWPRGDGAAAGWSHDVMMYDVKYLIPTVPTWFSGLFFSDSRTELTRRSDSRHSLATLTQYH